MLELMEYPELLEEILLLKELEESILLDYEELNEAIKYFVTMGNVRWIDEFIDKLKYNVVISCKYIEQLINEYALNKTKCYIKVTNKRRKICLS